MFGIGLVKFGGVPRFSYAAITKVRSEAKRRGPDENCRVSGCTSRCNLRAARRRRPCIIPAITRGIVRARPDYRETQRATVYADRTSIKSRKPLIGLDVHARCRVESVRHVSSSRERRRLSPVFRGAHEETQFRERRLPRVRLCVFFPFLFYLSFLPFFFCEVPRDRKRTIWNAAGCTAKRALITMTRIARRRPGY